MRVIQQFAAPFISISIPTTCSTKLYIWKYCMHHLFIIIILEILVLIVITPSNNYHLTIIYFNARLTLKKKHFTICTIKISRSHALFVCRWVQGETNRKEQATTTNRLFFSWDGIHTSVFWTSNSFCLSFIFRSTKRLPVVPLCINLRPIVFIFLSFSSATCLFIWVSAWLPFR